MQGNAPDEEHDDPHGECASEIKKLQGLLMSASRYVQSYSESERNHPQARDGAWQLAQSIKAALNI